MIKVLSKLILLTGLGFGLSAAHAIPCTQGGVSGSVSCQDGIDNNDKVSPSLTVNDEAFFGHTDWEYLQKQNTPGLLETNIDIGLIVTPTTGSQTGDWEFDSTIWNLYTDIMIVLKSGNNGGIFFSGYLLDKNTSSGTWDTGDKDLSHLTVYGSPIPIPATVWLFGSGLLGLVGIARRKRI